MSDELLPCPFCDGKPIIRNQILNPELAVFANSDKPNKVITCKNIDCTVFVATPPTPNVDHAIKAWNTRKGECE